MGKSHKTKPLKTSRPLKDHASKYAQKLTARAKADMAGVVDKAFEEVSEYLDKALAYTDRLRGMAETNPYRVREKLTPLSTVKPSPAKEFLEACALEARQKNFMNYQAPFDRRFYGALTTALGTKPVRFVLRSDKPTANDFARALVAGLTTIAVNYRKNPASGDFTFLTDTTETGESMLKPGIDEEVSRFAKAYFKKHWETTQ